MISSVCGPPLLSENPTDAHNARMGKVSFKNVMRPAIRRLVNPKHLWRASRLNKGHSKEYRKYADTRLKLLAQILPSGFLNYGYHEDPDVRPEELSLEDLRRAHERYGELVAGEVIDIEGPILDAGCGMGGLLRMLRARGHTVVGLTPDRYQIQFLRETLPDQKLIQSTFEDMDAVGSAGAYDAVIHSESLQYLNLDAALKVMDTVLAPRGRWVACDWFRLDPETKGAGHVWPEFCEKIKGAGWRIITERDITKHALPTPAFLHMWSTKLGLPLLELLESDLERKRPGAHYLMSESFSNLRESCTRATDDVDPSSFLSSRKYVLLGMERVR